MHAIIFAFSEILSWRIMKYIIFSGVIVTLIWTGIGLLIWDNLVALGSKIVEFVPFSMIRSNGAWMLSIFFWFQITLITFALLYAFFGNLILRKVSKENYSTFSILTLVASALFWGVVWFFKGDIIHQEFLKLLTWLPFETVEKGIAFLIGFYLLYNAIIVTMLFLTSLFSGSIIESMASKHFPKEDTVGDKLFRTTKYTLKDTAIFIGASLLALPLLFVPVVNIIIQILLWLWLTKDTMSYDAASYTHEKVGKNIIKEHRTAIWSIAFIAVLFNFIPVLNIFGSFFGLIAMFYYFRSKEQNYSSFSS